MWAVKVKKPWRKKVPCEPGLYWVLDDKYEIYVSKAERGLWYTREEAQRQVLESWEVVVEVNAESDQNRTRTSEISK